MRMRFLVDTVHPDYGYVSKDEVLSVGSEYVKDYKDLKIAEEADEANLSRSPGEKRDRAPDGWGENAAPASRLTDDEKVLRGEVQADREE